MSRPIMIRGVMLSGCKERQWEEGVVGVGESMGDRLVGGWV